MRRFIKVALPLVTLAGAMAAGSLSPGASDELDERIRRRVESSVAGEVLAIATLRDFYERRGFEPAWIAAGRPRAAFRELLWAIEESDRDGLRPADYHLSRLRELTALSGRLDDAVAADVDLLSTDAFLLLASHRLAGRLNPETIDSEWRANRRGANLAELLEQAVTEGKIAQALDGLLPPQPEYATLRDALADYRALRARGGWPTVPEGPTLKPGDEGPRVEALAARLRATGELDAWDGSLFDDRLERAVRGFQQRHGLETDGSVGAKTLAALNVPVEQRIRQLIVNLERWRWLPQELGARHVLVNIAGFGLQAVEEGKAVLEMPVIVGKTYRRTPVFSDTMSYLVLNPSWEVPHMIASKDLLPQFKKDPSVIATKGFDVFQGYGADAKKVDPATIDWSTISARSFPYRLRQSPGPLNALGQVKFMFPNAFNVYLHDTPSRELFARAERSFSSGCIRVGKPLELAAWTLAGQPGWDAEALGRALQTGREQTVRLARPVRVHLLYWTAWVDQDGVLQVRNDIYERDTRVLEALAEPAPEGDA